MRRGLFELIVIDKGEVLARRSDSDPVNFGVDGLLFRPIVELLMHLFAVYVMRATVTDNGRRIARRSGSGRDELFVGLLNGHL